MAEVLLICRFVARTGMEFQLRALLQGMLAPTYKPNRHVNGMNFMSQTRGALVFVRNMGKSSCARSDSAADDRQSDRSRIHGAAGKKYSRCPRNAVAA